MAEKITITLTKSTDIPEAVSEALKAGKTLKELHNAIKSSQKNEEDDTKLGEMISENGINRNIAG